MQGEAGRSLGLVWWQAGSGGWELASFPRHLGVFVSFLSVRQRSGLHFFLPLRPTTCHLIRCSVLHILCTWHTCSQSHYELLFLPRQQATPRRACVVGQLPHEKVALDRYFPRFLVPCLPARPFDLQKSQIMSAVRQGGKQETQMPEVTATMNVKRFNIDACAVAMAHNNHPTSLHLFVSPSCGICHFTGLVGPFADR